MKNYYFLLAFLFTSIMNAQSPKIDPIAIAILDHMGDVIGELESCTFSLSTFEDIIDPDFGLIKLNKEEDVIFKGPNKMLVHIDGDKGKKGYWYNGKHVVYYSYTENNYVTIEAPDNTLATIDSIHTNYGITFPAADFFYPSYTDDLLKDFKTIQFLGRKTIDNEDCLHIKATNATMEIQFWISNDNYKLPKKYLIVYKNKDNMQFEATFNNWELNSNVPDAIFEFTPPAKAAQINILAKK